jgi:hypothetical protein
VGAGDAQRGAADANPDAERLLDGSNMRVVLSQQIGKLSWIVEVKFERVVGG